MKLFLKTKDHSISGESFDLLWDPNLDMLVTQPVPANLARYYESTDYISHTDASHSFMDKLYQAVKRRNLKKKLQLINNQIDNIESVLDFGAGTGDFLATAQSAGVQVAGIEPNNAARQLAQQKGIALHENLEALTRKSYDVITLWHVLEHVPNLDEHIAQLKAMLKDEGCMVVAVPNFKSFDAKHYGSYWAAYDVPRHLWHFSQTAISKIFDHHGMVVKTIKPMWFDAFYVSMLSEKYKGNKWHLPLGFLIGLWSNLKAIFTKEYSSLIYVLQKAK